MERIFKMKYDGNFDLNGKNIYYWIVDDKKAPVYLPNGIVKMTRYFYYFDENGSSIGFASVYDLEEKLHNITSDYANKKYLQFVAKAK